MHPNLPRSLDAERLVVEEKAFGRGDLEGSGDRLVVLGFGLPSAGLPGGERNIDEGLTEFSVGLAQAGCRSVYRVWLRTTWRRAKEQLL